MPTTLSLDDHLEFLVASGQRLDELVAAAGFDARVPTCPAWDARALMAHQAMVHRWATAQVRGEDASALPSQTELRDYPNLAEHYRQGLAALVDALRAAPADLVALTFLNDAPPPRQFWARRQAHETTIHMVDALAGSLGRVPAAREAGIDRELALDGIDELLRGFFTRGKSKLYDGREFTFAVAPNDADRWWVMHVAEVLAVEPGDDASVDDVTATMRGAADALYLGLWNRGEEFEIDGDGELASRWRTTQRISWS